MTRRPFDVSGWTIPVVQPSVCQREDRLTADELVATVRPRDPRTHDRPRSASHVASPDL